MRPFKIISSAFLITGSIIGAGFITGRELLTFLGGNNIFSIIAVSVLMCIGINVLFCVDSAVYINKQFAWITALCNFIVVASMLAGTDSLMSAIFGIPPKYSYLSIALLVIAVWLCFDGIEKIEKFSLYAVALMVAVVLCFCHMGIKNGSYYSEFSAVPAVYASINLFLSSAVVIETGKGLNRTEKFTVSVIVGLVIGVCAFFILSALSTGDYLNDDIPLLSLFSGNVFLRTLCALSVLCGIATTLVSCFYTVLRQINKGKHSACKTVFAGVLAFALSRLGFSAIIGFLYPIIGYFGMLYLLINACLQTFSLSRQLRRTSRRRGRTK